MNFSKKWFLFNSYSNKFESYVLHIMCNKKNLCFTIKNCNKWILKISNKSIVGEVFFIFNQYYYNSSN